MNNAEEMQERRPELRPAPGKAGMKRCYQCNGHFGLTRHRFAQKHFCSNPCLSKYKADTERKISLIKEWRNYFARKP
jgi:hypothetical protein